MNHGRARLVGLGRISAICMGLGLGTALAADLAATSSLETSSGMATDDQLSFAYWRLFDPGFLVDHLPFKVTIGQTISYNDNVSNLPAGLGTLINLPGRPARGDFYSDTTIGIASRFPMGASTLFFNGTYAPRTYFRDTALNAQNYSINGGVDFTLLDRCSGTLVAGVNQSQSAPAETAGLGIENTMATSFNETARCKITGHIFGLLNTGISQSENTGQAGLANQPLNFNLNDNTQYYAAGGLEYDGGTSTLRGMATFTTRDFNNRPAGLNLGLAQETQQDDYQLFYAHTFSPKIDVNASGGFSVFSNSGIGSGNDIEPIYAFQINYHPTRKITASFSDSKSVGAPQSVVANVQSNESQTLSILYQYSPKISFAGILGYTKSSNPGIAQTIAGIPVIFANSESKSASLTVNYIATPLITATAGYSYQERTDTSRLGFNAVSNIFRVGIVYTR